MQLEVRNSPQRGFRFSLHVSLWFLRQLLLAIYAVSCFVYADEITNYVGEFKSVRITVRILKVLREVLLTELLALIQQPVPNNERFEYPTSGGQEWSSPNTTQQLP